ncbi:response regulator [Roseobacter sp.]|uniref:response regulator n=1 Tax=Roseobacter sp. TaxID=1907202 RepID=UPI0029661CDF|nr:response regulator [Roseobacter sp.]MDW3183445.1 response regulator [Roseobacter sp.]
MACILLMEDDVDLSTVLDEVLSSNGHVVTTSQSASEAFNLIAKNRYDLLITDIIVLKDDTPVPDGGISLISRLRGALSWNLEPWMKKMPIIAISGAIHNQGMSELLKISRDLGADMAFGKPMDTDDLLQAINLLTKRSG